MIYHILERSKIIKQGLLSVSFLFSLSADIIYPDFDLSMKRKELFLEQVDSGFSQKNEKLYQERSEKMRTFFKELYLENIEKAKEDRTQVRIPKIIHQIWLGSSVPEVYKGWMQTWAELDGWQYYLWTDQEVKNLKLQNQNLYDQSKNFGEKSDILRLELLSKYGGVYVDVDFECMKPEIFDELHKSFDFYIGFEPLEHGFTHKFNMFKVCNAILASIPRHPLIQDLITNLRANYLAYYKNCSVIQRTGPSYLTRMICEFELAGLHELRNMYLPCTFFYPTSEMETRFFVENPEVICRVASETAGFHYWCGSWWRDAGVCGSIYKVEVGD